MKLFYVVHDIGKDLSLEVTHKGSKNKVVQRKIIVTYIHLLWFV